MQVSLTSFRNKKKELDFVNQSKFSNEKRVMYEQSFKNGDNKSINSNQKYKFEESQLPKNLVPDLLNDFEIKTIEAGIVKYFLYMNNYGDVKNRVILDALNDSKAENVFLRLKSLNFKISLSDVEKVFELLVTDYDKQLNGAVYTPTFIVNYIVENTISKEGLVCDCSCGSGAFLIGSLKRLQTFSSKNIISLIENNLFGVDITDYSIRRTKIMLSLYALENNQDKEKISFNLHVADSLNIDWRTIFPEVFIKNNGFDFVVGNPPYVRIQDLKNISKNILSKRWQSIGTGNYNLYFAFFELGVELLNQNGKLGYITPNNYFTSLAGINLRGYLGKNKKITKILNFNHLKIFDNAQTYTCITFMSKDNVKPYFDYYYMDNKSELYSDYESLNFTKSYYDWLDSKKWRLMGEKDYQNIRRIETKGIPLNKLCPIKVGIATLKDIVYFVEDFDQYYCHKEYSGKVYPIEKGITRKIVKISSMKNEGQIKNDKRRIIFPYIKENGKFKIMSEKYLKEKYPNCYKYLLMARSELEKRDKGKKSYPVWFAWGRTQGMDYRGAKLYTRTFYHKPDFMIDEDEDNLFCNGYAVFCKTNIRAIQKILNSKIMDYYVKKTSVEIEGNYQCYQKNFIEKFAIPNFSKEELDYLESEDNKENINSWLIKKYNLIM
ncbi:Eco57I restriction-modification methylase domain-containing protein [Candidatus Woesearchaeota archaeon]|nr:Eco57I restriction-modification methylase domain-containing protein [Candidatus Woesearchaeota archaeon]